MNKVKQIIHRKLGKERANGLAFCEDGIIHIDSRLAGYDHLYTLIHEIVHVQNPKWSELRVEGHLKEMAKLIWENKYRQIKE